MHTRWIVFAMVLTAGSVFAAPPSTQYADPVTQIENRIKQARDEYQRALSDAIDSLEKEKQMAVADGDRERTGHIAALIDKLKGPLVASGGFADKDLDSLFSASAANPGGSSKLTHLVYDWARNAQFDDWRAENPPNAKVAENPRLVGGTLVFQGATGARLRFARHLAIRSIRLEIEAVDSFQAMAISIGNAGFRLHFASGYIADLPGEASKVNVNLQSHLVVATIDINPQGDATLEVAGSRVTRAGVVPGELCLSIDQPGALRIKSIVIDGAAQ